MLRFVMPICLLGLPALAAGPDEAAPPKPAPRAEAGRTAGTLDELFARLAAAQDDGEASGIARLVERRLGRSGSETADLLSSRAGEALQAKDYPLAIELLDRVLALEPGWADAWSRRAAAFHLLDDPASALADLRQALAREPRHFAAWVALGRLYMAADDKGRALEAFRRALALHPRLTSVRETVSRLAPDIDGRDL